MNAIPAYEIIADAPEHSAAVETLYDEVFGPGRFAKTAERLRENNSKIADASFVAVDAEGVTGVVRVWPVTVGGISGEGGGRAAFLGPIAVAERRRGNGVAFKLMERAIGVCREQGYPAVILVGDQDYYQRFGFKQAGTGRFQLPGPVDQNRVLIRDLSAAAANLKGALGVPKAKA
ncbi:MAG: N-acetyltransferase [Hyphomonadaceae bacterium]|nr:N-acetyltransferase [Hyphomonadaceae bacterium]